MAEAEAEVLMGQLQQYLVGLVAVVRAALQLYL
jgi:hypothetical protein